MNSITAAFSNRDIALVFWILIITILLPLNKDIRKSIGEVIKILLSKPLLISFLIFLDYVIFLIWILQKVGFWEPSLLKTTVFWFFGFAVVLLFRLPKAVNIAYFKDIVKDSIKLTLILEFLADTYTFNLWIEIVGMFFLVFLAMLQAYASIDQKNERIEKLIKSFFSLFGIFIFARIVYMASTQFSDLWTVSNAKDFLLPIILSLMFIPFIYIMALYSQYEGLFLRLKYLAKEEDFQKKAKWKILQVANINLDKISNISGRIAKLLLVDESRSLDDIRKISR
ncbi:MAG: hypothetical protein LCH81_14425 [Bacteroidetes bacterium]|nr:hypothetical protein [Bacteroidota bacterium]